MTNVIIIMTAQRGPVRLDEATREELERALAETLRERDSLLDHRAKTAQVQVARLLSEWDESDGPVLWWRGQDQPAAPPSCMRTIPTGHGQL